MTIMNINGIIILAATLAAQSPVDQVPRTAYDGLAVDLKSRRPVYTERHEEVIADGKRVGLRSTYLSPDGVVWATRIVDFSKSQFVPDFEFEDRRTGYRVGAEGRGDSVRFFEREDRLAPLVSQTLRIPGTAVVDAGFNNYVQANWATIASGKKTYINFGAPFAMDYYGFRVYKDGERTEGGRRFMTVKLDIDNFVIRLFLDPIVLTYDMDARRLVSYEGISNILNDAGDSYFVRISYDPYGP
ncbi:MAG: hypothetical protein MUE68_09405 [Bacteroidetes bacterium]|jgi:hypothetical protein|nr:hypothetical protein [Bacteroidota bacterium]